MQARDWIDELRQRPAHAASSRDAPECCFPRSPAAISAATALSAKARARLMGCEILACESVRVCAEKAMHLAHRVLCQYAAVGRSEYLRWHPARPAPPARPLVHEMFMAPQSGGQPFSCRQGPGRPMRDSNTPPPDEGVGQRCAPRNLVREPDGSNRRSRYLRSERLVPRVSRMGYPMSSPIAIESTGSTGSALSGVEEKPESSTSKCLAPSAHLPVLAGEWMREQARKPATEKNTTGKTCPSPARAAARRWQTA